MGTETLSHPGTSRAPSARLLAALRLLLGVAVLGLWEVSARQGWVDRFFFSAPSDVGRTLWTLVATQALYPHLLITIQEALSGLILGFIAGAALGWGLAQHRLLGELIEPVMVLLNAIPRIILAPLFIMWFGIGVGSKVALSFVLVFVVVFFAVYTGIREVDGRLVDGVLILGATRRDLLVHVHIPAIAAWVFGSLRVTVGFAFTGAVVGEFIAASRGLGYLLNFAQNTFNASLMMASLIIIVAFILLIFSGLKVVEEKLTPWKVPAT